MAFDSLTDSLATATVLLCMMINEYTGFAVDGYCGLIVSLFIITTGYNAAKDTITPLLGQKANPEFVEKIKLSDFARREILALRQNLSSKIMEYEK